MASDRWKETAPRAKPSAGESGSGISDIVRRALTAGFSGFFLTGEALREALGDSLPREWADFASEQSARARSEFIERVSAELGRAVEGIEWAQVFASLLQGRTLEVRAEIRLADDAEHNPTAIHFDLKESRSEAGDPTES